MPTVQASPAPPADVRADPDAAAKTLLAALYTWNTASDTFGPSAGIRRAAPYATPAARNQLQKLAGSPAATDNNDAATGFASIWALISSQSATRPAGGTGRTSITQIQTSPQDGAKNTATVQQRIYTVSIQATYDVPGAGQAQQIQHICWNIDLERQPSGQWLASRIAPLGPQN